MLSGAEVDSEIEELDHSYVQENSSLSPAGMLNGGPKMSISYLLLSTVILTIFLLIDAI